MTGVVVRPFRESDVEWAEPLLGEGFDGRFQARRGELLDVLALPGLVAEESGRPVGLLTYRREAARASSPSWRPSSADGGSERRSSMRCAARLPAASESGSSRRTTNLEALRFYQRRGFVPRALRSGEVDRARRTLKPHIATTGDFGIPIRDELELELRLV